MEKNRGIWITIFMILCVGMAATCYTRWLVARPIAETETRAQMAETISADVPGKNPAAAPGRSGRAAQEPESTVLSPLGDTATDAEAMPEKESGLLKEAYLGGLEETQKQVNQLYSARNGAQSSRAAAKKEWELWDSQLDQIYEELYSRLPDEEARRLESDREEREEQKEIQAAKSLRENGEIPAYEEIMARLTREQAYELVNTEFDGL